MPSHPHTSLGVLTDIPLTSESVAKLYNFVAMSERGEDNGVSIRRKNVHQLQGKLLQVHMKKGAFISFLQAFLDTGLPRGNRHKRDSKVPCKVPPLPNPTTR